ncbi:transglutaminase-like domain-containing protein [Georgenia halophila]|uniref:Transglutaminase-like domain-containing protein n=1 Tax=Georgenia halophila TaxID=620889 RepID=A0ABP8LMP9_9MICO
MRESEARQGTIGAVGQLLAQRWVDVAVIATLVVVACVPLQAVFGTARLAVAVVGGVLLGTAVAVVAAGRRWGVLPVLAGVLVLFVVFSALGAPETALGGVVPTPETIGAVGRGVVTSWKDVVTILPPLGAGRNMLTAPYVVALVASCVAVTVALRTRRPASALVVPAVVLAGSILLGTIDVTTAIPLGLGMVAVALVWASWRTGRLHANRWPGVAALVLVGLVAGTGAGLLAPPAGRLVLREHVQPPPDLHDYPSPLAGFRQHVKDHRDQTILTVENLPDGAEVRLATLDEYDGTAWSAADPESGTGDYLRIGDRIEPDLNKDLTTATMTIGAYEGVWVPTVGKPYDLDFRGPRSEELTRGFYFNRATGTGLTTVGLREGDSYEVLLDVPPHPTDSQLEGAPLSDIALPEVVYPDVITTAGQLMAGEASTPIARIRAIEQALQEGYFSHGLEGEAPSLAGHGAARLDSLLGGEDPMVGDEEQYAAAMGLILRSLSIPARVVMGFEAQSGGGDGGPVELTGDDVSAWVEVAFEGHGWVPFYPTPDEDRIWQDEETVPQSVPQPQVLQPPPPAQEPPEAPPSDRQDVDIEDDELEEDAPLPMALYVTLGAVGALLLLLAPLLVIVAVKLRRRRRRRNTGTPSARVAGGWAEMLDAVTDLGVDVSRTATRSQAAGEIVGTLAAPPSKGKKRGAEPVDAATVRADALATSADAGTFGPVPPDEGGAAVYWKQVDASLSGLRTAVGRRRWWRARISARSLGKARRRPGRAERR